MINTDGSCRAAPSGSLEKSLLVRGDETEDVFGKVLERGACMERMTLYKTVIS